MQVTSIMREMERTEPTSGFTHIAEFGERNNNKTSGGKNKFFSAITSTNFNAISMWEDLWLTFLENMMLFGTGLYSGR